MQPSLSTQMNPIPIPTTKTMMYDFYQLLPSISAFGFILPLLLYRHKRIPHYFIILLILVWFTSILYWTYPETNTSIHNMDKLIAYLTIIVFFVHNILYNRKTLVFVLLVFVLLWNCYGFAHHLWDRTKKKSIIYHLLFHILCSFGIMLTFMSL